MREWPEIRVSPPGWVPELALEGATAREPCDMCLSAMLWSGVTRVICGAARADVTRPRFEEGRVFPESDRDLEDRGVRLSRNVLRAEAVAVMERYRTQGGVVYTG